MYCRGHKKRVKIVENFAIVSLVDLNYLMVRQLLAMLVERRLLMNIQSLIA